MSEKPYIRTIHVLSCSGGTVISKCLSAMEKTIVISEIHPDRLRMGFNPFDPVSLLLTQTKLGQNATVRRNIFLKRIKEIFEISKLNNFNLILRDHTHTDYLENKDIEQINSKKSLIDVVRKDFKLLPLLIIRNPLHAYQSLLNNNMRQSTSSFNDYCNRVMLMINTYKNLDCSIFKYEDFCLNPDKELDKMCAILKINYLNDYYKRFSKIPMTGNSGRAVESEKIVSLDPRPISDELKKESEKSKSFKEICFRFDYKIN
tara:strand:+ start:98 stop:877 length:780 start_codon:yes stop_codon:yes gene_type:complete